MRLQLRFSGPAEEIFNRLTEQLQVSQKDVILDALALLHFAAEQVQQGRKIGSYDPAAKEFTALTTASLEALASRLTKATHNARSAVTTTATSRG